MPPLPAGSRLGHHRILELLGEGGMGAVYRARDDRLGRIVALKVLGSMAPGADELARFRREARAAAAISHANVIRIYDVGEEAGVAFIALELAPGGSLADRVKRGGPLAWRDAARVGAQVARGLAAVHAAGFVHRDLKPANVLFDEAGTAKLADFGLVRAEEGALSSSRQLTRTGDFVGTPEFASPEQLDAANQVGPASDLFSLGGTLHEALTGRRPFDGQGPSLIFAIVTKSPTPVRKLAPEVPEPLERLVSALLEKSPEARPPSAAVVAAELEAIAAIPATKKGELRVKRLPARVVAGAAVAVAAALAVALAPRPVHEPSPAPGPPAPSPSSAAEPSPAPSPSPMASPAPPRAAPSPSRSPHASHLDFSGLPPPATVTGGLGGRFGKVELWGSFAFREASAVKVLGWSPDGGLVTASVLGWIRQWDPSGTATTLHEGVSEDAPTIAGAVSPDGRRIVLATQEGRITLWDLATPAPESLPRVEGLARCFAWSGADVIAGTSKGAVVAWHGQNAKVLLASDPRNGSVSALAASGDGRRVVAAFEAPARDERGSRTQARLALWDGLDATVPRIVDLPGPGLVRSLALSPSGKMLAVTRSGPHGLAFGPFGAAEALADAPGSEHAQAVVFADERAIVSLVETLDPKHPEWKPVLASVVRWELDSRPTRSVIREVEYVGDPHALAVSADGKHLAISRNAVLEPLDIATGEAPKGPEGYGERVYVLAYDDDGTHVLAGDMGGTASIHDSRTGERVPLLDDLGTGERGRAHTQCIVSAGALPPRSEIGCWVTSGFEGTWKVWNAAGRCVHPIEAPPRNRQALGLDFTLDPAGKRIFTTAHRGGSYDLVSIDLSDPRGKIEVVRSDPVEGPGYASGIVPSGDTSFVEALSKGLLRVPLDRSASSSALPALPADYEVVVPAGDGRSILAGLIDGRVAGWTPGEKAWRSSPGEGKRADTAPIACAAAGGIAAGVVGDRLRLWSWPELEPLDEVAYHAAGDVITALALSPRGHTLVAGTERGVILRFELTAP